MTFHPETFREAMRCWATGVSIVAAHHEEDRHGMTVSSFTSLALDPPLVMVSLESATRTCQMVLGSRAFGVTILDAAQQPLAERFSGRDTESSDRFQGVATLTLETGSPLLEGGLALFDCRVRSSQAYGTNTVLIGEVVQVAMGGGREPLLYFDRGYRQLP